MNYKIIRVVSVSLLAILAMSFVFKGDDYPTVTVTPMGSPGNNLNYITVDTITQDVYACSEDKKIKEFNYNSVVKWDGKKWNTIGKLENRIEELRFLNGKIYALVEKTKVVPGVGFAPDKTVTTGCAVYVYENEQWTKVGDEIAGTMELRDAIIFNDELYITGNFKDENDPSKTAILKHLVNEKWVNVKTSFVNPKNSEWASSACVYNGKLIIAGHFELQASDGEADCIATWDGNVWTSIGFNINNSYNGISSDYYSLIVYNNELIVGGSFFCTKKDFKGINNIFSWNGKEVKSLKKGFADAIGNFVILNANLYVGGNFQNATEANASFIAMWDGTDWHHVVKKMSRQKSEDGDDVSYVWGFAGCGNKLFISGFFASINDTKAEGMASLTIGN